MRYSQLGGISLAGKLRATYELLMQDAEKTYISMGFNIKPKLFPVFYEVWRNKKANVRDLSVEIRQSHVAVSRLVTEMVRIGIVRKSASTKDQRSSDIELTAKGEALVPAMKRVLSFLETSVMQIENKLQIDLVSAIEKFHKHISERPISSKSYKEEN